MGIPDLGTSNRLAFDVHVEVADLGIWAARSGLRWIGRAAHLEFHTVGIPKEERERAPELLDFADLLRPCGFQSDLHPFQGGTGIDRESEVVHGAPVALTPPLADDLLGRNLEDVQGGPAADVNNLHPRMILAAQHFAAYLGIERLFVEADRSIHVSREGADVVEPNGDRHQHQPYVPAAARLGCSTLLARGPCAGRVSR